MAPNMAELCRRRDAVKEADLVELRLDTVSDPDPAAALAGRTRPVIVTCRPEWEGGTFSGSEDERRRILAAALSLGAEYVDLEWRAGFDDLLAVDPRRIVLSYHDFAGIPADVGGIVAAMRATGAAVVKLAVRASGLSDCLVLRDVIAAANPQKCVLVGMGEAGLPTRILAGRYGSAWTYAGDSGAVGQLSPREMIDDYRVRDIGERSAVYGVVGAPVSHSVSPAMHNAALRVCGIDAVYLPLAAADAGDFIRFGRAIGLSGASVTIPFKVELFERVDRVSAAAARIGAVNTIYVADGKWVGDNTDEAAFLQPLRERGVSLAGLRASVLGAGGSARAVAAALASSGAQITIHARSRERARAVARQVSAAVGAWPPSGGSWDLVVNCTPVGMHPLRDATPLPAEALTGNLVYDLVYNPPRTRLLREAAAAGCDTVGGLDMLVAQAEEQFRLWTGMRPPGRVMRDAALRRLSEFTRDETHVV